MEKLILHNVNSAERIIKAAANMRIKCIITGKDDYEMTLDNVLCMKKDYKSGDPCDYNSNERSLIVFCDVTDKHMDKLLFELRNSDSNVDYKACLTAVNRKWKLSMMLNQMEREKLSYMRQIEKK
ncbi:MAG: DUF3783 domain-containing protein [Eubacteriales bacterium]|nr:DUF3783 domain-containing protein [Eubacteriales bacterium]